MSAEEKARFTIQSLLARGLGATEVARRTGLARASEVWGGDEPLDRPAWYVWLAGSPGAYKLELEESEDDPLGSWRSQFTIRYYPSPDERAFEHFSAEERETVRAGLMDGTGTPRIETASRIARHLFLVGSMEWVQDVAGAVTMIGLSALDRLVVRDASGTTVRDVPGWRLGAELLTTFAGLHAQVERQAVRRIRLSRQPGFEQLLEAGGPRWHDTVETVQAEAALLFGPAGPAVSVGDALLSAVQEPDSEVAADEWFDGACRHPHSLEADPRIPLRVSHAWFGGEAVAEDRIACAC